MLKYLNTKVVFREVPDEISLAINLTNCPNKCEGCHSPQLRKDIGTPLTNETLLKLIKENTGITCVLFMGGDNDLGTLFSLQKVVKDRGLKTAWYSGRFKLPENLGLFDFIKLGPYVKKYGGLDNPDTNQKFYKVIQGSDKKGNILYSLLDQTYLFHK